MLCESAVPAAPADVAFATPVRLPMEVVPAVALAVLPRLVPLFKEVERAVALIRVFAAAEPVAVAVALAIPGIDPPPPVADAVELAELGDVTLATALAAPPTPLVTAPPRAVLLPVT